MLRLMQRAPVNRPGLGSAFRICLAAAVWLGLLTACRSPRPFPPINTSLPGWKLQQGQAVWRPSKTAPEIAGEIVVATHPDGRGLVQFEKVPLPLLVARTEPDQWQIQYVLQQRIRTGRGQPPVRHLWLHAVAALRGFALPPPLRAEVSPDGCWHLANPRTGERLIIDLGP